MTVTLSRLRSRQTTLRAERRAITCAKADRRMPSRRPAHTEEIHDELAGLTQEQPGAIEQVQGWCETPRLATIVGSAASGSKNTANTAHGLAVTSRGQ